MLQQLKQYINNENLLQQNDRLILAISGGVDSMVMLNLFENLNYDFIVLHCNFKLRANESDSEEIFLRDYCSAKGIELFVKHFDTYAFAKQENISIEMAARELRYAWFEKMRVLTNSTYILTAHHSDDIIETMLINLSRGTGIKGLIGIQARNENIIRPLLFASRTNIEAYAQANQVKFMIDSSNYELIYQRNIIRHKIIPIFEEINSGFRKNTIRTASNLNATNSIYAYNIEKVKNKLLIENKISIVKLKNQIHAKTYLYEILNEYGFNSEQCKDILASVDSNSGKAFFSKTHRIIKDREEFIITTLQYKSEFTRFYINKNESISNPIKMDLKIIERCDNFKFPEQLNIAMLDADKLNFPLILKKWEQGEYFSPLGMKGMKKLSDFFTDQKMSIPEKENQWVLYSGNDVVWIIGKRIDNRFKITSETKNICNINFEINGFD